MDREANLSHWERWAGEYGTELRATTKCVSIKRLEIEAILRRITAASFRAPLVLEIGCGNGANGFALTSRDAELSYVGLDFAPKMIAHAVELVDKADSAVASRMAFGVADARRLAKPLDVDRSGAHVVGEAIQRKLPADGFDVVFTDRMLINLATADEQLAVMRRIGEVLRPGGMFLMIENSVQTHRVLNELRGSLGLPPRPAAEYNVFIDEPTVIEPFARELRLEAVEDFAALHDLMLYAVGPSLSGGHPEYDSPLMTRVTDALLAMSERGLVQGACGQNRLWVFRK